MPIPMQWVYSEQIIACAALLLAAILIQALPSFMRKTLFVVLFGTGVLAFVAGIATDFGTDAVTLLFG
jgi:hypothetical protein